jgi:hypothetical protein
MQYGIVLGKHQDISRAELYAQGISFDKHYGNVALFTHDQGINYATLGGIVKWGVVIQTADIEATDLI